jgi:UDP-N-acetylmuramoylalanine-D-glutamate ligase
VLLCPGAASFDEFDNFERRGEAFVQMVKVQGDLDGTG